MKNFLSGKMATHAVIVLACLMSLASCNKKLPIAQPILYGNTSGSSQTIMQFLASDPNFTILLAAIQRARPAVATVPTLTTILGDSTSTRLMDSNRNVLTIYAPNNAAFIASGIPSVAAIATLRTGQLDSLLRYHIIPGEQWTNSGVTTAFPNVQLPSLLSLGLIPGTVIPFNLSVYPSRRTAFSYINNVPLSANDKLLKNGVLHTTAFLVTPPSLTVGQVIAADPNLTFFQAMIARSDVGATDPTKTLTYATTIPFANTTVFAPNNTAVRTIVGFLCGGCVTPTTPDPVVIGTINALPVAAVQGITAYHILPVKAFSNNIPTTPTLVPTLINGSVPTHPGVSIQSFFTAGNPLPDSLKVLGVAPSNGGIPATSKPRSAMDRNAINGVLHVIDKVLLPQ